MPENENKSKPINVQIDSAVKPEPIIVQMESIAPVPITMGGGVDLKHDWYRLLNSVPFQMYCAEKSGQDRSDVEEWIVPFTENEVMTKGEDSLFDEFSAWHGAKGHWKNETVYGDLIEGDN